MLRMQRLDLTSETWVDMGFDAPAPPTWAGFIFSHDGLLYRLRGREDNSYYDTLSIYNPETSTWQTDASLPSAPDVSSRYFVSFTLNVIGPKA